MVGVRAQRLLMCDILHFGLESGLLIIPFSAISDIE